jgi:hypothetical protein
VFNHSYKLQSKTEKKHKFKDSLSGKILLPNMQMIYENDFRILLRIDKIKEYVCTQTNISNF